MAEVIPIKAKFSAGSPTALAELEATDTIPPAHLGTGTRDGTKVLRDDGTWVDPSVIPAPTIGIMLAITCAPLPFL